MQSYGPELWGRFYFISVSVSVLIFFLFGLKTKRPRDQHFFQRAQDPRCVYVAWSRAFENPLPAKVNK